jgi:hypothetical protein
MKPQIIYIKGVASPEKAEAEEQRYQDSLKSIRSCGVDIEAVGGARNGFGLEDLKSACSNNPDANIIIADIHGNIEDGHHWMSINKEGEGDGDIWVADFYKALTEFSESRPLNVFMLSCGSGNGCKDAVTYLPLGSTLINLIKEDVVFSYPLGATSFKVIPTGGTGLAEALFINFICNGLISLAYDGDLKPVFTDPQLSVCAHGLKNPIFNLWELAKIECLEFESLTAELVDQIRNYLKPYTQAERIEEALATFDLFRKAIRGSQTVSNAGTPVTLNLVADEHELYERAVAYDVFGPMCVIAYCLHRKEIGAFQTGDTNFYLGLMHPETKNPGPALAELNA